MADPPQQQQPQQPQQTTQFVGYQLPYSRRESEPAFTAADTDEEEQGAPKKKRRRQALSCTECKRRKIKCDRNQPCSQCARRGEGNKCVWNVVEPVEKYVSRTEYDDLKARFDQLEGLVHHRLLPLLGVSYYQHQQQPEPGPSSLPYAGPGPGTILYPPPFAPPPGASPRQSPTLARRDPKSPHSLATITSPFAPPQESKNSYAQMFILSVRLRMVYLTITSSISSLLSRPHTSNNSQLRVWWGRHNNIYSRRCICPRDSNNIRGLCQGPVLVQSLAG